METLRDRGHICVSTWVTIPSISRFAVCAPLAAWRDNATREAGVTRQAIGQVIAELERLDIVTQIPDPNDARAKIVRYTPFGKRGYLQALAVFTQLEHEAIQIIGPSRIAALKRDLERLSSIGAS